MASEEGRHIGDGADVGFFVLPLIEDDRRRVCGFGGEDDFHPFVHSQFVEALAEHASQSAIVALGNVGNLDFRRVELAARAHGTDNGQAQLEAVVNQKYFGGKGVYGINNVVVSRRAEDAEHAVVTDKFVQHMQTQGRIDAPEAGRHHFRLGQSHVAVQCQELAVFVGRLHDIAINDSHFPDAGAAKLFRGISPHSPQTYNQDMGTLQTRQFFFSQKQSCTVKPIIHGFLFFQGRKVTHLSATGKELPEVCFYQALQFTDGNLFPQGGSLIYFFYRYCGIVCFQKKAFRRNFRQEDTGMRTGIQHFRSDRDIKAMTQQIVQDFPPVIETVDYSLAERGTFLAGSHQFRDGTYYMNDKGQIIAAGHLQLRFEKGLLHGERRRRIPIQTRFAQRHNFPNGSSLLQLFQAFPGTGIDEARMDAGRMEDFPFPARQRFTKAGVQDIYAFARAVGVYVYPVSHAVKIAKNPQASYTEKAKGAVHFQKCTAPVHYV